MTGYLSSHTVVDMDTCTSQNSKRKDDIDEI